MGEDCSYYREKLRHEFDRASILTIDGASANYFKELNNRGKREISFFELSEAQLGKLYTVDEYSVENFFFQVLEYDIEVRDSRIAMALKKLTERKRDVILLYFFMDMNDVEIAKSMNLVRSTVCEHRKRSLEILKEILKEAENANG